MRLKERRGIIPKGPRPVNVSERLFRTRPGTEKLNHVLSHITVAETADMRAFALCPAGTRRHSFVDLPALLIRYHIIHPAVHQQRRHVDLRRLSLSDPVTRYQPGKQLNQPPQNTGLTERSTGNVRKPRKTGFSHQHIDSIGLCRQIYRHRRTHRLAEHGQGPPRVLLTPP